MTHAEAGRKGGLARGRNIRGGVKTVAKGGSSKISRKGKKELAEKNKMAKKYGINYKDRESGMY